jgi:membrane protein DedA with SNARE-associated domain
MAAGALSARGEMQPGIVLPLAVVVCLAADGIWFWFGRLSGFRPLRLLCALSSDPRRCFQNAQQKFHQYGLRLLFVSKFLPGVDGIMPPLGGAHGVSFLRFLAFDAPGSFLWSGFYMGIG